MKIANAHVPLCANAQRNLIVVVPAGNNLGFRVQNSKSKQVLEPEK